MNRKVERIKKEVVPDRIKQTLEATGVTLYDWMFDIGLHDVDLLVYAILFDILRHEPLKPQRINLAEIGKRIHYTRQSIYSAIVVLVDNNLIYTRGERTDKMFSLYPFDTLDLK